MAQNSHQNSIRKSDFLVKGGGQEKYENNLRNSEGVSRGGVGKKVKII